jgi:hypothetical protein
MEMLRWELLLVMVLVEQLRINHVASLAVAGVRVQRA